MTLVLFGRNCKFSYIEVIAHLLTVIHKIHTEQIVLLETKYKKIERKSLAKPDLAVHLKVLSSSDEKQNGRLLGLQVLQFLI
jgi:hypothetical protein